MKLATAVILVVASAVFPRQQPAPAPPDALPEGFVLHEEQKSQFTIALPKGWVAYDQSKMFGGKGNSQFNLIFFYLSPNPAPQEEMSVELIRKIDSGEISSFFVQKLPAKNGMSCAGFPEKAEKNVFKLVTDDPMFGKGATIVEAPRSEPISVAGCKGIRILGTGKPAKGDTPQTTDVHAASDGQILYLFTLRGTADNYKKNTEVFQKAIATARLTAAK